MVRRLGWLLLLGAGCLPRFLVEPSIDARPTPAPSAERGQQLLLNRSFLKSGVPIRLVDALYKPKLDADDVPEPLEGRRGVNGHIPAGYTGRMLGQDVASVTENCLLCHAGPLRGAWTLGLGNSMLDAVLALDAQLVDPSILASKRPTPDELAVLDAWTRYQADVAPWARATTPGSVAALYFTGYFFSHRQPDTLQWVAEAAYPMLSTPPPETDIPAWWLLKKKSCLYYGCELKGDFTRSLMQFMSVPGNSGEDIRAAEADFQDVLAYLLALQAPRFPGPIDAALAARGQAVFHDECEKCHGTYGATGKYPNKLVPLEKVKTDPARSQFMHELGFADHFNHTWFGERSKLEATEGYLAPPLDGVWATAPYLHNGSVPTLEALLDPSLRPRAFVRTRDSRHYDLTTHVGWDYTAVEATGPGVYDTTRFGKGNQGHGFAAGLGADQRRALLEYLKTL